MKVVEKKIVILRISCSMWPGGEYCVFVRTECLCVS